MPRKFTLPGHVNPTKDPTAFDRIAIYWPAERKFFTGVVYQIKRNRANIWYDDGDEGTLHPKEEAWDFVTEEDEDPETAQVPEHLNDTDNIHQDGSFDDGQSGKAKQNIPFKKRRGSKKKGGVSTALGKRSAPSNTRRSSKRTKLEERNQSNTTVIAEMARAPTSMATVEGSGAVAMASDKIFEAPQETIRQVPNATDSVENDTNLCSATAVWKKESTVSPEVANQYVRTAPQQKRKIGKEIEAVVETSQAADNVSNPSSQKHVSLPEKYSVEVQRPIPGLALNDAATKTVTPRRIVPGKAPKTLLNRDDATIGKIDDGSDECADQAFTEFRGSNNRSNEIGNKACPILSPEAPSRGEIPFSSLKAPPPSQTTHDQGIALADLSKPVLKIVQTNVENAVKEVTEPFIESCKLELEAQRRKTRRLFDRVTSLAHRLSEIDDSCKALITDLEADIRNVTKKLLSQSNEHYTGEIEHWFTKSREDLKNDLREIVKAEADGAVARIISEVREKSVEIFSEMFKKEISKYETKKSHPSQ